LERDLTVIYLIGGSPRVGKSTLAKLLSKEKSIPYISADDAASVITPYIPESEYAEKLPLRTALQATKGSNDVFYSKYSADEAMALYIRQAETLWAGFRNFIRYVLDDEHEYILEGWQILPYLINSVMTPENKEKIAACFLYKENIEEIASGLKSGTSKLDWVINNTKEKATFMRIAKMISSFGKYTKSEAEKYDLRAVNMDFDFNRKIKELSESL
jgi:2-phosphoglycerate kinase